MKPDSVTAHSVDPAGIPASAVVLLSGGLDSTTLLFFVLRRLGIRRVHAVSFDYGQKHARELGSARFQAQAAGVEAHAVIDLGLFRELAAGGSVLTDPARTIPALAAVPEHQRRQPPTYVPNRNLILLSLAVAYAEARGMRDVYYGAQTQDEYGYWDCTGEFVERVNAVLALNRGDAVRVHAPFAGWRKARELQVGLELGIDYGRTWSCYRGGDRPCGDCPACVERAGAFRELGQADPLLAGPGRAGCS